MDPVCKCDSGNYKMTCPYTFEQGGSRFHCIGGDMRALPADQESDSDASWDGENENTGISGLIDALKFANTTNGDSISDQRTNHMNQNPTSLINMERELKEQPRMFTNHQLNTQYSQESRKDREARDSANEFLAANRTTLRKFEALHLNGKSINDYSIGGFNLNVETTTKKVKELAPLPPNALPKIFIDDNLNFYHHFFKGMEILLGNAKFQEITDSRTHHEGLIENLPDSIIGFMESGMCAGDSALTLLVKKVLSSTFCKASLSDDEIQTVVLRVETNLWGFRYIEPGMILADADIKMWLANCYSYYRTIWFDTFKSSGVPNFAIEGVIMNTNRPILKMATTISQTKQRSIERTRSYDQSSRSYDQSLTKYENPDYRKRSAKSSRKNSWF
jgi:hypothetical protein